MSSPAETPGRTARVVDPDLLRSWPLPATEDDKYGRGQVVVVGGARRAPGAAMLSGLAALRVGAGRLTLAVGASVASHVAVALPECGIVGLDETPAGGVSGFGLPAAEKDLSQADAVLLGPGLDDADDAKVMVRELSRFVSRSAVVVLDAFALGVLPALPRVPEVLGGRLVLTPNKVEAALLLERELDDLERDVVEIARRYSAVVSCYGIVADATGSVWNVGAGSSGLATSGSGDVLAGAVAGLCARGATPAQAAVWATFAHAAAGDRLAVQIAPLGYLASELLPQLPVVLASVGSSA
jgi:ADP-dependent NAD(P)H-hydrate dehydratase